MSSSSVSRAFVQASAAELKAFQERDLSEEDLVALFLDGKSFAETTMVVALGGDLGVAKRITPIKEVIAQAHHDELLAFDRPTL